MNDRSEDTRNRIMSVSMKLFAERGFDGTGVAEICEQAGLSKGAFYHHFPTKQAVFLALLDDWLGWLEKELFRPAEEESAAVPELLLHMARRTREVFSVADGRVSIFLEFWAQARKDPETWSRTVEPFRRYRALFAGLIRRGTQEGSLANVDPEMAAFALVSLAVGVVLQGVVDTNGAKWDEVMVNALQLLLRGMEK